MSSSIFAGGARLGVPEPISIHAPLTGCDLVKSISRFARNTFQSTHPLRGATLVTLVTCTPFGVFQSTHPLRGATTIPERHIAYRRVISIHAPLAGCDHPARCSSRQGHHFNPRTPCGVRHPVASGDGHGHGISIHAPLVGCDAGYDYDTVQDRVFQSTHPLRGATLSSPSPALPATHFNPRTPCGVRPYKGKACIRLYDISIHAPLAGCPFFPGGIPTHRRRRTHPVSGKKCAYPG